MLQDQRITESRERFNSSRKRLDEARTKVAAAEKALEDGRAETERALAGEAKARVDAAPRAGEMLRKEQSRLGIVEREHAAVLAEHERVIGRGPTDEAVAAHEAMLANSSDDLAEYAAALRTRFDSFGAALDGASKDVESIGLSGLARGRRQADEGLALVERFVADLTRGGWRR